METKSDSRRATIKNLVVYGEKDEVLSPEYVNCQRMEIVGQKHHFHIKPHIHSNLFQLHMVEQGDLKYTIDGQQYEINEPVIVVVPENILHELEQDPKTIGKSVSISYSLLEQLLEHYPKGLRDFERIELLTRSLNPEVFDRLIELGEELLKEYEGCYLGKELNVRNILGQILIQILRLGESVYSEARTKEDLNFKYYNAFQNSIRDNCSVKKQIKDYALELKITPTHLNRICNQVVGKSAKQVVLDHMILIAKRHLLYSNHSVSEIGYLMEFDSPSYFTRYFKKQTHMTPKDYRLGSKSIKN